MCSLTLILHLKCHFLFDLIWVFSPFDLPRNLTDFKSSGVIFSIFFMRIFPTEYLLHFPFEWIHEYGEYYDRFTFSSPSLAIVSTYFRITFTIDVDTGEKTWWWRHYFVHCGEIVYYKYENKARRDFLFVFFQFAFFVSFASTCVERSFMQMQSAFCTMCWKFDNDLLSSLIQCINRVIIHIAKNFCTNWLCGMWAYKFREKYRRDYGRKLNVRCTSKDDFVSFIRFVSLRFQIKWIHTNTNASHIYYDIFETHSTQKLFIL